MPRTRSLAWAELKIGIIAVFALVMAAILIFAVGGSGGFFWQSYPLKTIFMDVAGIKAGSPVRVAGVEVGTVDEVRFSGTGVEVWFDVRDDMKPLVTNKSHGVDRLHLAAGRGRRGPHGGARRARRSRTGRYVPGGIAARQHRRS